MNAQCRGARRKKKPTAQTLDPGYLKSILRSNQKPTHMLTPMMPSNKNKIVLVWKKRQKKGEKGARRKKNREKGKNI